MRLIKLGVSFIFSLISLSPTLSQAADCGGSFYCYGGYGPATVATPTRPAPIPPPNTYLRRLQQRNLAHMYLPRASLSTSTARRSSSTQNAHATRQRSTVATPTSQTRIAQATASSASKRSLATNRSTASKTLTNALSTRKMPAARPTANLARRKPATPAQRASQAQVSKTPKPRLSARNSVVPRVTTSRHAPMQLALTKSAITTHTRNTRSSKRATTKLGTTSLPKAAQRLVMAKAKLGNAAKLKPLKTPKLAIKTQAHPLNQSPAKTAKAASQRCTSNLAMQNKARSLESAAVAAAAKGKTQLSRSLFNSAVQARNRTAHCR